MIGQSAATSIHALLEARSDAPAGHAPHVAGLVPSIAFDGVGFAYPGRRGDAHVGLSFEVAAGETVGIVGPEWGGQVHDPAPCLRQHDVQAGMVRIGGHDIRALDSDQVRGMIAIVAQDTTACSMGRSRTTCASAGRRRARRTWSPPPAPPMRTTSSRRCPKDTRHGSASAAPRCRAASGSASPSPGALLRDAPILVLDEALSSVDAENEAVIQQALDRLMQGRTTLILAHRLSSVIGADRILVLDQGRVVETGTHAALIARSRAISPPDGAAGRRPRPSARWCWNPLGPRRAPAEPEIRPLAEDAAEIGWARRCGLCSVSCGHGG